MLLHQISISLGHQAQDMASSEMVCKIILLHDSESLTLSNHWTDLRLPH